MRRQGEEESPGQVPAEDRVLLFAAGSLTLDGAAHVITDTTSI